MRQTLIVAHLVASASSSVPRNMYVSQAECGRLVLQKQKDHPELTLTSTLCGTRL
jgi:hypothetical protein